MKDLFEYAGVDREELWVAMEIVGAKKFTAICMLMTCNILEEHGEDLLEQVEEAEAQAKEILKEEEVDGS